MSYQCTRIGVFNSKGDLNEGLTVNGLTRQFSLANFRSGGIIAIKTVSRAPKRASTARERNLAGVIRA